MGFIPSTVYNIFSLKKLEYQLDLYTRWWPFYKMAVTITGFPYNLKTTKDKIKIPTATTFNVRGIQLHHK